MESRSGRLGFAKSRDNLVPFPGMGTRLRRSRSREHSAERDNLSTDLEISHLRQSRGTGAHLLQGGTLERPKRLFYPAAESDTSSLAHQPSLYGLCRATKAPLYEQSRLGHQYEEPHLVLDCLGIKDAPYYESNTQGPLSREARSRLCRPAREESVQHNSLVVLDRPASHCRPNTTVIPPSKLFAKTLTATTSHKKLSCSEETSKCQLPGLSTRITDTEDPGSGTTSVASHRTLVNVEGQSESALGRTRDVDPNGDCLYSASQYGPHFSSGSHSADRLDAQGDPHNDTLPKQHCLTSSSHSSVVHTYANPFQHYGSSVSEDTTGPIIPDINTLRPSQLLKNSFAASEPLQTLQSPPDRNLLSLLAFRLRAQFGSEHKMADLGQHRCGWRASTLTLTVLVFVLIVLLILLSATSTPLLGHHHATPPKVPCIVVEDVESPSHHTPTLGRGALYSPEQPDGTLPSCAPSLPRDPLHFAHVQLAESGHSSHSIRLDPYSAWPVWFSQPDPSYLRFSFSSAVSTRLAVLANKNEPASLTSHHVLQTVGEARPTRLERDPPDQLHSEWLYYFEAGSWYVTLVNDSPLPATLSVDISSVRNESIECPSHCHHHGLCHLGHCQCFPGFIGPDCADNVCPVLCSGHGQYLQGSCRCESGWKGRECSLRSGQCEVPDCNGNGECEEGRCRCRAGFKGEVCDLADCPDPLCASRGLCVDGTCLCQPGWTGTDCTLPDSKLHRFLPNCSSNGVFDYQTDRCICHGHFSGPDCSRSGCSLDCGPHGECEQDRCKCQVGWSGPSCRERHCDARCLEHGTCRDGQCLCQDGWMGKFCTLEGCPNQCSQHGQCVPQPGSQPQLVTSGPHWACRCAEGWGGRDCSSPQETNCTDEMDNDDDGLVDCADSECCVHESCGHQSLMCITSPDPLDILLRKQPPSPTASFFHKVRFLIEEGSVQSYAQKDAYSERRVAVIRGQVVSKEQNGLIGIRVSVETDPQFGFTLTRSDGWFDILVNGGGIITLQFQRNPFHPIKKSVLVAWNEIHVIQNPIVMLSVPDSGKHFLHYLNHRAFSLFYSLLAHSDFGEINWSNWFGPTSNRTPATCSAHDPVRMRPSIRESLSPSAWLARSNGATCGDGSCVIGETQSVLERVAIGGTGLHLVYQSSSAAGYLSTLHVSLTPDVVPESLRFVLLRVMVEGQVHERVFEAESSLQYSFEWNKRNVYRQKVFGFSTAKVYVGYIYLACADVVWSASVARLGAFQAGVSEVGSWNVDIHHRYRAREGLLQRGDGQVLDLRAEGHLVAQPVAGVHLQARPLLCAECDSPSGLARLLSLAALATSPDGSLFVGDANLVRRLSPLGALDVVFRFATHSKRQSYEYYLAFNSLDAHLYISDPERFQIVRVQTLESYQQRQDLPEAEVVVGSGQRCFPHDPLRCLDGQSGPEVHLLYPKGLAFALDGSLFFADGNVIRMLDTRGRVRRVVGQWRKRQWKPLPCSTPLPADEVNLHWPASLAIDPLDGSVYFVDNYVLLALGQDMRVRVVAGYASFCQCHSHTCAQDILLGQIAFSPSGSLYASDLSGQRENRILRVDSQSLQHVAGLREPAGASQCPVERCVDLGGHNCTCLIQEASQVPSVSTGRSVALETPLFSVTGLAVAGDGTLFVADEGSLRVYSLAAYSPAPDQHSRVEILSADQSQVFSFDAEGHHLSTRSTVTGHTLYSFQYSQHSQARLASITDSAGNKVTITRDSSGVPHSIDTSSGVKCRTLLNPQSLLERVTCTGNHSVAFDYLPNGLIRSRMEASGETHFYRYSPSGRLASLTTPTGALVELDAHSLTATTLPLFRSSEAQSSSLSAQSASEFSLREGPTRVDIRLSPNGSLWLNSSSARAHLLSTASALSGAQFSLQSRRFPLLSLARLQWGVQSVELGIEYRLRAKSPSAWSVAKSVSLNHSLALVVEFDRKSNRQIYYNHTRRPVLSVQLDEVGRPVQWVWEGRGERHKHGITYDALGHVANWQLGPRSHGYVRDRAGRLAEVRYMDHVTRYSYSSADSEQSDPLELPSFVTLASGRQYSFETDPSGRLRAVVSPKGFKFEVGRSVVPGYYRHSFCPPPAARHDTPSPSRCYLQYSVHGSRPVMRVLPFDSGKLVFHYDSPLSLSKSFAKDLPDGALVERTVHGSGLVEKWLDAASGRHLRGIWWEGQVEFALLFKYTRHSGLLKQQSQEAVGLDSSHMSFTYRYDSALRIRSIQSKLASISLSPLDLAYDPLGNLLSFGPFRYLARSPNETVLGDGTGVFVRRVGGRGQVVHSSLAVAGKEVFRADYAHNALGLLVQSRTYMRHLGANKVRVENFTYDPDGQLAEVSGGEQWRFLYDLNGNLVTLLYMGNRIDLQYDPADRLTGFGKGQADSGHSHSAYVVDSRGFVVRRGEEHLSYNNLGQLTSLRSGRSEVTYTYDYRGRLVARADNQRNVTQYFYGNPAKPHLVTHLVNSWDGRVASFLYDQSDSVIHARVNNDNYYVVCDHNRSPLLVFDHRGQVAKEVQRSPHGHVLFDSSPSFHLPVDFHGGIGDPLAHLVLFGDSPYDTLTGQYLVPRLDSLFQQNLLHSPSAIHAYHYAHNDPVNPGLSPLWTRLVSPHQVTRLLASDASQLLGEHLQAAGVSGLKQATHMLAQSGESVQWSVVGAVNSLLSQVQHMASLPGDDFSKIPLRDWASQTSTHSLLSVHSLLIGPGILLRQTESHSVLVEASSHSSADLRHFCSLFLNQTRLLDLHLVMGGEDHYFLLREEPLSAQSAARAQEYHSVLNFTLQSAGLASSATELRLYLPTVQISVRYGTDWQGERDRVQRMAREFAVRRRMEREQSDLVQHTVQSGWGERQRHFILQGEWQWGPDSPLAASHFHHNSTCPELAEDSSNVLLVGSGH